MGGEAKNEKIKPSCQIGRLTVIEKTPQRKNGYVVWRCKCECGGEINLDTRTLQRGSIKDCGCKTKVKPGQKDVMGQRFGLLVALNPVGVTAGKRSVIWRCRCDCGGEVDASLSQLTAGYRRSCGCIRSSKRNSLAGRKFGRLTVLCYEGKDNNRMSLWKCKCDCGKFVNVRQDYLIKGKTKSCGCYNRDSLKERLGLIDGTSITILRTLESHLRGNNTSGYTGVYLNKKSGRWISEMTFKGKRYYLGSYSKKMEAINARKLAEEKRVDFLQQVLNG